MTPLRCKRKGNSISTTHNFPPELRDQLAGFDNEIERQIRSIITDGIVSGDFRPDLDPDNTAFLLRHALTGVSELVAATPERAAHIVDDAAITLLAAITTKTENPQ